MNAILHALAHFFFSLGGIGLLLLGVLDSSFLMLPLGNDLLVTVLTARNPDHLWYYVAMATTGSTLGVTLLHTASSRMGRKIIEGSKKSRRVAFVERKIEQYGGIAIALAALAPPGFPFTPFIVLPAVLQYPLKKMAVIIAVCRVIRFGAEGMLARVYGKRVIELANSALLQKFVLALIIVSVIGSAISIWGWIQKGKASRAAGRHAIEMGRP